MHQTKTESILAGLNENQQQAVLHTDGPALILAGAGSGKTRALTHRIAHLIDQGVEPWQILAVTFTNKAATEMKERIASLLHITEGTHLDESGPGPDPTQKSHKLPVMGTFHSICVRILRRDIESMGGDRNFVIYDADDQQKLMKEVLREMGVEPNELKPKAALGYVSRFKSEALSTAEVEREATSAHMQRVVDAFKRYQKALRQSNALDFDDLLLETVRLFHECPDVLQRYQNTWRYLHVDEYQDTNHVQYLFITMLASRHRNLCVIGDPDQSIYAFRGADIRNILEFEKEYPDAFSVTLDQNYRSAQPILTAADAVIALNPNRPDKTMWTERKEGPTIVLNEVRDEKAEAQEAVRHAIMLKGEGTNLNQQVILYRTNAQSRQFEEACMREGIPYRIVGGLKFYARKEVKDVLAYLHVILNPGDTLSLLRIINTPARKIGPTTIGRLQEFGSKQSFTLWECLKHVQEIEDINEPTKQRLSAFVDLIERYREKAAEEVVSRLSAELLDSIGMEKWLRDDTEEGETRWQNVQELLSVMHKYDNLEPKLSLTSFLEEVALVSEVDKLQEVSGDALTLMTLHLCKGLEFEGVTIAGCEEGIFPHSNSLYDREQLEEERRLMYVGMTRAKTHLHLLLTRTRMLFGQSQANAPSRFLEDLPEEVVERRTDDVMSAFAWAAEAGNKKHEEEDGLSYPSSRSQVTLEPYRQHESVDADFNQDIHFDDDSQESAQEIVPGTRVRHHVFGEGTVKRIRGDVADIDFDHEGRKSIALNIVPLDILS